MGVPSAVPKHYITPTGLAVDVETISFEEWEAIGERLARSGNALQWAIGDWAWAGERRFAPRYKETAERLGMSPEYLRQCAKVANNIPEDRRRPTLSWSHHKAVAFLPYEEQERLLDLAEEEGLSKAELELLASRGPRGRNVISSQAADDSGPQGPATEVVRLRRVELRVVESSYELWETTAHDAGLELEQWAIETLNEAAGVAAEVVGEEIDDA